MWTNNYKFFDYFECIVTDILWVNDKIKNFIGNVLGNYWKHGLDENAEVYSYQDLLWYSYHEELRLHHQRLKEFLRYEKFDFCDIDAVITAYEKFNKDMIASYNKNEYSRPIEDYFKRLVWDTLDEYGKLKFLKMEDIE